jgi:nucleotide-binding universal stress UspA family protein
MKILVPVDGSQHTKRMLEYIAAHGELLGAGHEYVFFTAISSIPPHAASFLDRGVVGDYYRDQADLVLKPVGDFAREHGWKFRVAHGVGSAAETISKVAVHEAPDLIVMGTHGHSSLANVVLGSVASGVLARCKVPLLLIH